MKKKKILFRNRSLEVGGIENVLLTILQHLDRSKFEIIVLLNYNQGEFLGRIPNDVKLLYIGEGHQKFSKNKFINTIQKTIRRFKYYKFQKNPKTFYSKNNLMNVDYEIAFSHYMVDDILNSPNKSSKKIFWVHGNLVNSGLNNEQNKLLANKLLKFDHGVFVSNYSKNIVEKTWNIKLDNSTVIHNPIEIENIIKKSEEKIEEEYKDIDFISIGRLFWQKGFMDLIRASIKLKKEGYTFKILLLGDGVQKNELKEEIINNNLQDYITLFGHTNNPYKYLKNSKYFILPSYSEGYPLVVVEAILLNKYILSTNVGGIPEIVTNDNIGILSEPGENNIYLLMKKTLDNPPTFNKKSKEYLVNKNNLIFKDIEKLFN